MSELMFPKVYRVKKDKKSVNRVKKTPLSKLKRQADALARAKCYERGACQICGSQNSLQWAHVISRRYHCVRWRMDNCLLLCSSCHTRYTYNPDLWIEYIMDHYSEGFRRVMDIVRQSPKVDRAFMEGVIESLSSGVK